MKRTKEQIERLTLEFAQLPFDKKKDFLKENSFILDYHILTDSILLKTAGMVTVHELSEAGRIVLCRKILIDAKRMGIEQAFDEYEKLAKYYHYLLDKFFSTEDVFEKKELFMQEPNLLTLIGIYFLNEKTNQYYRKAVTEISFGSLETQIFQAHRALFLRCFEFGIDFTFEDYQKTLSELDNSE